MTGTLHSLRPVLVNYYDGYALGEELIFFIDNVFLVGGHFTLTILGEVSSFDFSPALTLLSALLILQSP